jgi:adenosine deaminase
LQPGYTSFLTDQFLYGISFFPLFKLIYQLTDDIEAIKITTKDVIDEFARDGTKYLELRSTPRKYADTDLKTKDHYVQAVLSVVNQPRDDIVVKLILSVDRRNTLEEAMETVDLAIKYKNQGVVAVDLCGDVHAGSFDTLKSAFLKAQEHGLKVTLHFCEVSFSFLLEN